MLSGECRKNSKELCKELDCAPAAMLVGVLPSRLRYGRPSLSPPHICGLSIRGFKQLGMENIRGKKTLESSKKQNLSLPGAGNYLHGIYVVGGILSNLEMIWGIQEDVCS